VSADLRTFELSTSDRKWNTFGATPPWRALRVDLVLPWGS